ncbi:MAG: acetylglutamate kinase [Meiothermus ruber]|uniref:Acetylglutamate kinase n=1 Tax=Meiothermus ruber TaxID=277 RepID=A0A7C3DQE4_MEIRU|nr:acetylglutamate kinase [Meiothermus sp.]MCX8088450.1 acetylglutamate kinase [Meiothermus ruber]
MEQALLVKIGGSLKEADDLLEEISAYPGPLVLVHGGGPRIAEWLNRLGFETHFHQGLRITPPEQMEVVEMVLTTLGKHLADGLSKRGRPSVALTGRDAGLLEARLLDPMLGRVGEVTRVNTRVLQGLLQAGLTPLIAPIGLDAQDSLNINADIAAGAIAGALGLPAIFLTDVVGVLRDPKDPTSRLVQLNQSQVQALLQEGIISGGMIPKVEAALNAVQKGAPWATIARGGRDILRGVLEGRAGTRILEQ